MKLKISASLMCADIFKLAETIDELDQAAIDMYHVDIMDGHFVPNLGSNFDAIRRIKQVTRTPLDVHLMVDNPEWFVDQAIAAGSDSITFHLESAPAPLRLLEKIRRHGVKAGLAINPVTPASALPYAADFLDMLVIMTVEPGSAGQKFIPSVLAKIAAARSALGDTDIAVDGNIDIPNALGSIAAGANVMVAGTSALFKKEGTLAGNLRDFRQALRQSR